MKNNKWLNKIGFLSILFSMAILSCNKDVDQPEPNTFELPKGSTIGKELSQDPSYSLLFALVNKVGLANAVSDSSKIFTVFAPDNNAIKTFVSAFVGNPAITPSSPDIVFLGIINGADSATTVLLKRIVNYHIIPGQAIKAADIGEDFANTQYPTNFIFPSPNTNPLVRFTNFISRRQNAAWVNNIPVALPDYKVVANGVVHGVAAVILPPSRLLLDTIARDQEFSYLVAAIKRADSGLSVTSSPSFQYFLGEPTIAPGANFTVFAPTNQAFQNLISGLVFSRVIGGIAEMNPTKELNSTDTALAQGAVAAAISAGPAIFSGNSLTTNDVRGIVAYHVIPLKRAFSVNFPSDAQDYTTLLNSSIPDHKGLKISSTLINGFGVGLSIKGLANSSASSALGGTANLVDRHAVNGVFYKVNQVLLPIPPPTILSFEPASAKGDDTVTITGINLTGASSVRFGGVAAKSFQVTSSTTIKAVVDPTSVNGNVDLRSPLGFTFKSGFTLLPTP